jgi:deoxyribonucleoside regulator
MDYKRLELLAQVASLYYESGLTQQQIAVKLGYSRSMISRLLTEAHDAGVVEIHIHYPLERCPGLERILQQRLGLQVVQVLARGSLTYEQMLRRLGLLASRLIETLIEEGMVVGVSWGSALRETVNAMQPKSYSDVKVVQIIGALDTPDPESDGPDLARNLARLLGGQYLTMPAPLIVESPAAREALLNDPRVRKVLALASQMTIALMGIGSIEPNWSSLLRAGYITRDKLAELAAMGAVGDVCAIHFNMDGQILNDPLCNRRVGISVDNLLPVPIKLGIAGGEGKIAPIVGACRAGMVNHLVTDEVAALGAIRLLEGVD